MPEIMAPMCSLCDDSGWKQVAGNRVTACECRLRRIAAKRMSEARIPERYRCCAIHNYQPIPGVYEKTQAAARLAVGTFVENAIEQVTGDGLLLVGPVGVGKTHLAVGIINEFLLSASHLRCLFRDYRELLSEIRHSYNPAVASTEAVLLEPVFGADVLVLDELGAERASDWVLDTVSRVLNTRYNRSFTTILTTNFADLPPTEADVSRLGRRSPRSETLGDRITEPMRSRLHEMCRIVEIHGEDFRFKKRNASKSQMCLLETPMSGAR